MLDFIVQTSRVNREKGYYELKKVKLNQSLKMHKLGQL